MKKSLIIVIGVIFAGAAGVAWNVARGTREADAAFAAVAQKEAWTNAQIRLTEKRLDAAESEAARLRAVLAGLQEGKAPGPAVPPLRPTPTSISEQELAKKLAEFHEQVSKPIGQVQRLAQQGAKTASVYRPLFGTLRLSPAQTEKFIEIDLKSFEHSMDLEAVVGQGIVSRKDPVIAKLKAEAKAEEDASYRELLGEDSYQRLQEYRRGSVAWDLIQEFAAAAVMAGAPFTAPQLEQVVQVVANASSSYRSGQAVELDGIDWDIVDAQVRELMSSAQWEFFKMEKYNRGYSQFLGAIRKAVQADMASKVAPPAKAPGG